MNKTITTKQFRFVVFFFKIKSSALKLSKRYHQLTDLFIKIKNSIAFYPTLIVGAFTFIAILSLQLENKAITKSIFENINGLLYISDPDTARGVLNTLVGGIISLTVFSFSMVMILLNQASSNYSPRLLPGLITDKRHQFVLGFYLGTIVYMTICNVSIIPGDAQYDIPGISILLSLLFGFTCLVLFVYFIHSISQSIQINNILYELYIEIKKEYKKRKQESISNTQTCLENKYVWTNFHTKEPGYLINISKEALKEIATKNKLVIRSCAYEGTFIHPGKALFQTNQKTNDETLAKIIECFHLNENRQALDTTFNKLHRINDVALKAMSPGINDPGTAQLAINYIILLLSERINIPEQVLIGDEHQSSFLIMQNYPFDQLLSKLITSLRIYISHDLSLVEQLAKGLDFISSQTTKLSYLKLIAKQKTNLLAHAEEMMKFEGDIKYLKTL